MENIDFLMKLPIFYNLKKDEIINILKFFRKNLLKKFISKKIFINITQYSTKKLIEM